MTKKMEALLISIGWSFIKSEDVWKGTIEGVEMCRSLYRGDCVWIAHALTNAHQNGI